MYLRSNSRRLVTQKIGHPAAALIDPGNGEPNWILFVISGDLDATKFGLLERGRSTV